MTVRKQITHQTAQKSGQSVRRDSPRGTFHDKSGGPASTRIEKTIDKAVRRYDEALRKLKD